jgi:elongation factor Ts
MKISPQQVKELRDRTGAGVLACKKALQETGGEIEKAIDILRAEGAARAAKRESREAREGIICLRIGEEGKTAALLELNCETDFVARTGDFTRLAEDLADLLLEQGEEALRGEETRPRISGLAATIGEKITLGRAVRWEKEGWIGGYLHHNGRAAALVEISENLPDLAGELAMQVIASNPPYLREEDVDPAEKNREWEIFRQQVQDKPEAIQEKIIAGKWRKRLTELCLVDSPFCRDDKISVARYLERQQSPSGQPVKLLGFARLKLGES